MTLEQGQLRVASVETFADSGFVRRSKAGFFYCDGQVIHLAPSLDELLDESTVWFAPDGDTIHEVLYGNQTVIIELTQNLLKLDLDGELIGIANYLEQYTLDAYNEPRSTVYFRFNGMMAVLVEDDFWPGDVTLTLYDGRETANPTDSQLRWTVSSLGDAKDAFAILSRSEMTYVQVAGNETSGFMMEYQEDSIEQHYQSRRDDFSIEEIVQALIEYRDRKINWSDYGDWVKLASQ